MEIRNNEMRIGDKMTLFLDQDNILNSVPFGDISMETVLEANTIMHQLTPDIKGRMLVLVDLNRAGKQSVEVRKTWDEMSEEHNASVALFGMHYVAKTLATFFMHFTKNKNIRFFSKKDEAVAWLKEERKVHEVV